MTCIKYCCGEVNAYLKFVTGVNFLIKLKKPRMWSRVCKLKRASLCLNESSPSVNSGREAPREMPRAVAELQKEHCIYTSNVEINKRSSWAEIVYHAAFFFLFFTVKLTQPQSLPEVFNMYKQLGSPCFNQHRLYQIRSAAPQFYKHHSISA